jgi:hypothetical protein
MKNLFLLLIVPFLSFGQVECINGKWPNCYGKIEKNDKGEYWKGDFKEEMPWNGNGKLIYENDTWFGGEWKNGKWWNGNGKIIYENDTWFEGEWKNGKRWNGNGKIIYENDYWFEGELKEGEAYFGEEFVPFEGGVKCNIYYEGGKQKKRICNHENVRNSEDIISGPKSKEINLINYSDSPNAYYIYLTINKKKVRFHFDTGCSNFTMNLTQWKKLKKGLNYEDLNILINSQAVGAIHPTKYYKILEPIQIDDFSIKNVIIGVTQITSTEKGSDKDNLIGIGFFKKFSNAIWNMDKESLEIYK